MTAQAIDKNELAAQLRRERDRARTEQMLKDSQARADAFFARLDAAKGNKLRRTEPAALAFEI